MMLAGNRYGDLTAERSSSAHAGCGKERQTEKRGKDVMLALSGAFDWPMPLQPQPRLQCPSSSRHVKQRDRYLHDHRMKDWVRALSDFEL